MASSSFHPSFGKGSAFDLVHEVANTSPEAVGLIFPGGQISYLQFSNSVVYLAEELIALGVKPGQLVAVDLPPHMDFVALLSINLIGAVSCAVFGMSQLPSNLSPDWLLASPESSVTLNPQNIIRVSERVLFTKVPSMTWKDLRQTFPGNAPARLVYTSGTTGNPKAIVFTSELIEVVVNRAAESEGLEQSSVSLIYFSRLGLSTALLQIAKGLPIGLSGPRASDCFEVASQSHATHLYGSPVQVLGLLAHLKEGRLSLPSLKAISLTGGVVGKELITSIRDFFPQVSIEIWYGSNEVGRVSSQMVADEYESSNVGQLLPGVEVEIVNEHGNPTEDGQVGLIRVRTDKMATQYFNDVFQTANSFVGGWFQSGDLGLVDFDDNLILRGRLTDLINAGGNKINPAVIETKVLTLAGILECAGVEVSSRKGITEFALAVVGPQPIDTVRLSKLLKSYFPNESPTIYAQMAELPRNQNGKVDRRRLRSWFEAKLA